MATSGVGELVIMLSTNGKSSREIGMADTTTNLVFTHSYTGEKPGHFWKHR